MLHSVPASCPDFRFYPTFISVQKLIHMACILSGLVRPYTGKDDEFWSSSWLCKMKGTRKPVKGRADVTSSNHMCNMQ